MEIKEQNFNSNYWNPYIEHFHQKSPGASYSIPIHIQIKYSSVRHNWFISLINLHNPHLCVTKDVMNNIINDASSAAKSLLGLMFNFFEKCQNAVMDISK